MHPETPLGSELEAVSDHARRPAAGHGPVATARALIRRAFAICVLTGAGISTQSGIPDFRGPDGLWTKNPGAQRLSTLAHYIQDQDFRIETWRRRAFAGGPPPQPNAGHRALVELEAAGRLELLITQNVDGLHRLAGTSPDRLVELHGSLREQVCLACGRRGPMAEVLERVRHGDLDPHCQACGGILKSAAISFGQRLEPTELARAEAGARSCDLFLAVGTRLEVFPAAELPAVALHSGAPLVVVNQEPTSYDRRAAAVIRSPIGEVLGALLSA